MNKFHIFGGIILLLVLVVLILTSIIGTTDGGKNLSNHACGLQEDYTVDPQVIRKTTGESCLYSVKPVNSGFIFSIASGNAGYPDTRLRPTQEVTLATDCAFFDSTTVLVLDSENKLYACVNI